MPLNLEELKSYLAEVEHKYGVSIIYAAVTGSHQLGFAHEGSDVDVQFVYTSDPINYLPMKVGNAYKSSLRHETHLESGTKLDMEGMDVAMFADRLFGSRRGTFERLMSSYVLVNKFPAELWAFFDFGYCNLATLAQLVSEARTSLLSSTDAGEPTKEFGYEVKRLMNALVRLLQCVYIENNQRYPKCSFDALLTDANAGATVVPPALISAARRLMRLRQNGVKVLPRYHGLVDTTPEDAFNVEEYAEAFALLGRYETFIWDGALANSRAKLRDWNTDTESIQVRKIVHDLLFHGRTNFSTIHNFDLQIAGKQYPLPRPEDNEESAV